MEKQMLEGKVAIITGASYGMGQTMAELFAEEGASVVLTARGYDKLDAVVEGIRAKGWKAIGVVADVCSVEDTQRVFNETIKEFGDVDILINNAGIGEQKMIDETEDEWMLHVMNTNLGGPMRYIRDAPSGWRTESGPSFLRPSSAPRRWSLRWRWYPGAAS